MTIIMKPTSSSEMLLQDLIKCRLDDNGIQFVDQSLTLEGLSESSFLCYPSESKLHINTIPYKDVLACELIEDNSYKINYVIPSGSTIKLKTSNISIDDSIASFSFKGQLDLSNEIIKRAYSESQIKPSILILINPHGGPGKAKHIFQHDVKPILEAANADITVEETKYSKHATDIARDLDINKYDIIACCSGDGIPHEVINGFYQRSDKGVSAFDKIAITQLPGGSGNALSLSTHGSNDAKLATFNMLKSVRTKIDLMALTQLDDEGNEVTKLSFLSQCYGTIADADIGTEHLRWMGPIRFDLGVAHKVITKARYPCELYVNYATTSKQELTAFFNKYSEGNNSPAGIEDSIHSSGPKLSERPPSDWIQISTDLTDNINIFYVGNMPMMSADAQFFPAALPNDGTMDMVLTDCRTPVLKSIKALLSVDKGAHVEEEGVVHHKVRAYRLIPKMSDTSNHHISIDGENFPFREFQVEVIPSAMTGLLTNSKYVPTSFTK